MPPILRFFIFGETAEGGGGGGVSWKTKKGVEGGERLSRKREDVSRIRTMYMYNPIQALPERAGWGKLLRCGH